MEKFWCSNASIELIYNYIKSMHIISLLKSGYYDNPSKANKYIQFENRFLEACEKFYLPIKSIMLSEEAKLIINSSNDCVIPREFHLFLKKGLENLYNYLKEKELREFIHYKLYIE
jgi:hypothetical protein